MQEGLGEAVAELVERTIRDDPGEAGASEGQGRAVRVPATTRSQELVDRDV